MSNGEKISTEWVNYIDPNKIDIYPIQFANCDRLQANDAVYIFDEVGSGKTISSGLMALDYLYNNKSSNLLIITTNALVRTGQFLSDWYDKLPFEQLELKNRIEITNNHHANIKKFSGKKYGLIIVDEAHLFLNIDSYRYNNLKEIKAEKIVFLTATPIKNTVSDLQIYVGLAKKILGKETLFDWTINEQKNAGVRKEDDIISNQFDVEFPVTRYFKDTIQCIRVKEYEKNKARRLIPQVWEYETEAEDKDRVLLKKIILNQKDNKNRFVIFTRYVEKETEKIEELLKNNGFKKYVNDKENGNKTYKIVTGKNSEELSKYTGKENLPTVLILTYQVAEQGVNLPGYNYVINYHISAFPSALEQRFGRIDRMNSDFEEINMCFLISKKEYDSNTWNFYSAMITYLYNLIPYIPSRNTILSKEILEQYVDFEKMKEKYKQGYRNNVIEKQLENMENNIEAEILEKDFNNIDLSIEKEFELSQKYGEELFEFINEKGIEYNNVNETKKEFIEKIKKELEILKKKEKEEVDNVINQIKDNIGDNIFYFKNSWFIYEGKKEINNISAVECGTIIEGREEYVQYKNKFEKTIKFLILFKKFKKEINDYFEEKFIENDFDSIFPFGGYQDVFEEILNKKQIEEDDKQCLIDNCDLIVKQLPFFEMCEKYGKILQNLVENVEGEFVISRFRFNPFEDAFKLLTTKMKEGAFDISEKLFREYFSGGQKKIYGFECKNGMVEATNWYKLAYYYTRREARCFIKKLMPCQNCLYGNNKENIYFIVEKKISDTFKKCCKNKMNREEISTELLKLDNELKRISRELRLVKVQSLFTYYIFTENGKPRKYVDSIFICDNKEKIKDIWTRAICTEINQKEGVCKDVWNLKPEYIYISLEQFKSWSKKTS